jgi:hypothetical protein
VATYHVPQHRAGAPDPRSSSSAGLVVLALFLGIAVAVLTVVAVVLLKSADDARDDANAAAATTDHASHVTATDSNVSLPLQSFAGQTGEKR